MMFRIACDRRDSVPGRYHGGDRPLVYLALQVGAVVDAGLPWVATDGNARAVITRFTDRLADLTTMVDQPLMRARMWNSTPDDPDRERRRMAELLIHRSVPLMLFHEVGTYSEEYSERTRRALGSHPLSARVVVRRDWYYGYELR